MVFCCTNLINIFYRGELKYVEHAFEVCIANVMLIVSINLKHSDTLVLVPSSVSAHTHLEPPIRCYLSCGNVVMHFVIDTKQSQRIEAQPRAPGT